MTSTEKRKKTSLRMQYPIYIFTHKPIFRKERNSLNRRSLSEEIFSTLNSSQSVYIMGPYGHNILSVTMQDIYQKLQVCLNRICAGEDQQERRLYGCPAKEKKESRIFRENTENMRFSAESTGILRQIDFPEGN